MFQDFFKNRDSEPKAVQDLLNDEYNDSLSTLDMDMMTEKDPKTSIAQTMLPCDDSYIKIIRLNNTKSEEYINDVDVQSSKNPIQEANEKTPKNQIMKNAFVQQPLKKNNPKKRLKFGSCEKPISLKLNAIYEYMFDSNILYNHSAEADCLAMMRCVIKIADFFLDWSKNHAIPLICCKKT